MPSPAVTTKSAMDRGGLVGVQNVVAQAQRVLTRLASELEAVNGWRCPGSNR